MFYLAMVCRFSYYDLLEMEATERVKWVDMALKHKEREAKSFKKVSK